MRTDNDYEKEISHMVGIINDLEALNADLLARVKILEKWGVLARMQLVNADSEFSAVAHGRPSSDKAALLEMSSQCRKLYDGTERGL